MNPIEYVVISKMPWAEPHNPGPNTLIAHGAYPMDATQLSHLHDELICIHTNHVDVYQFLKCIILEAYTNMYTSQLEDYLLQYANGSAIENLVHLHTTYASINPTQLVDYHNKMASPISFQYPIETLFKHIEDGVQYSNADMQPYMEA
jgi:hypothetical protein